MSIKSHIQIPISIIKSFSHTQKVVSTDGKINTSQFVYTLKYGESSVESVGIKDYGSQLGYFNEEIEKLLGKEYETPLGETKKKVLDFAAGKTKTVDITPKDFLTLKNYFKVLLYRNEHFFKIYKEESVFAKNGIADQPSDYVETCHELNITPIPNFELLSLTMVIATGKKNFINNYCGFSYLAGVSAITNDRAYIVPLSPRCCVIFFIPKSNNKEDCYLEQQLASDDDVKHVNRFIATTEKIFTKNSLISLTEEELTEVVDAFNKD